MSLSRKHFQDLADIIKEAKRNVSTHSPEELIKEIENNVSYMCKKYNSSFDFNRFHDACALEEQTLKT